MRASYNEVSDRRPRAGPLPLGRRARFVALGIASVLVVLAAIPLWVPAIGASLRVREPIEPSDAIVVLAGNAPDRLRHGAALYHEGYAPLVIVSDERVRTHGVDTTWKALFDAGVSAPDLPHDAVIVLGDPMPESTIDEARRTAALLVSRGLHSAILVTDSYHSRRARLLFGAAYADTGLTVRSSPTEGDGIDLDHWWIDARSRRTVAEEYTKFFYYLIQGAYW